MRLDWSVERCPQDVMLPRRPYTPDSPAPSSSAASWKKTGTTLWGQLYSNRGGSGVFSKKMNKAKSRYSTFKHGGGIFPLPVHARGFGVDRPLPLHYVAGTPMVCTPGSPPGLYSMWSSSHFWHEAGMVSDTHNQPIAAVKPASTQRPMLMQWDELTCQQTQSVRTGKSLLQLEEVCFLE